MTSAYRRVVSCHLEWTTVDPVSSIGPVGGVVTSRGGTAVLDPTHLGVVRVHSRVMLIGAVSDWLTVHVTMLRWVRLVKCTVDV